MIYFQKIKIIACTKLLIQFSNFRLLIMTRSGGGGNSHGNGGGGGEAGQGAFGGGGGGGGGNGARGGDGGDGKVHFILIQNYDNI